MPVSTFNLAFIAGRFDADRTAFAAYCLDVVTRANASVFITTETYGSLADMRRMFGRGWRIRRSGEYVIGVRKNTWRRTRLTSYQRVIAYYKGRDDWKNLWTHRRTEVHRKTGQSVLLVGGHVPKMSSQRRAHDLSLTKLGRVLEAAEKRRGIAIVAGLDTNADHHDDEIRANTEAMMRMDSCWTDERPAQGTHGRRLIDAVYANVPLSGWRISTAARPPLVDHRAVVGTVKLDAGVVGSRTPKRATSR